MYNTMATFWITFACVLLGKYEKKILHALEDIKYTLKQFDKRTTQMEMKIESLAATSFKNSDVPEFSLPLNNDDEMTLMESLLSDTEKLKSLAKQLSLVGGMTAGPIIYIMKRLMHKDLSVTYSSLGRKGKRNFSSTLCFKAVKGASGVRITNLKVPDVIMYGDVDSVVLDCEYTVEAGSTDGLMVKWFFDNHRHPVYQWIYKEKPQAFGPFKGRVNLAYKASEEPKKAYRAMHIQKPTRNMTGQYRCVVSTYENEDSRNKSMLVFMPQKSLNMEQEKSEDSVKVLCSAEDIFPLPIITFKQADVVITEGVQHDTRRSGDLYSIAASVVIPAESLANPTSLACELSIPTANYTTRKEALVYAGTTTTTTEMPDPVDPRPPGAVDQPNGNGSSCVTSWFPVALMSVLYMHLSKVF